MGRSRVAARLRDGRSVLSDLYQQGASKVLVPRTAGTALTAVTLNTAGGMTGGDSFTVEGQAEAGAHLVMTTQAAERVYRAQPGEVATLTCKLEVGEGARLDWLPQETILYDACALSRRLTADLAPGARFLMVEPLIFGRAAMGERLRSGLFRERIEVRRDGALVFADATRLGGDIDAQLDETAIGGGARAMASLLFVCDTAEAQLGALRALLPATGGASLIRPGVLFARVLARDGYTLRQSLLPAIERLSGAPLPRTWML
ncbi:urease accessory protein UreD [Seohaeicola zhoushanensis]|uniref:Urease accessory protein UreD n=1 Tax=Seohaeicola zhoushanensis TaxID=1569283 RepID=A0A8J3GVC2_9RHOB|nr:urease accessory protein UreD [Seohaeicola zhoushanensis]GHF40999.1 urease accessory protein UreD [Seohaeicola zhoushanensis]